tara:strand:+ start:399 stop:674 length:276 start_codon:yes stop_codon:yes gene_type:complete
VAEYKLPDGILSGELVYIHGIHDFTRYSWGWALAIDGPLESLVEDRKVDVWKVLFRGKLVLLRSEEFTRFAFYNRHLTNEDKPNTPKKMVS